MIRGGAKVSVSTCGTRGLCMHLASMLGNFREGKKSNLYGSAGYRRPSHHSTRPIGELAPGFSLMGFRQGSPGEGELT